MSIWSKDYIRCKDCTLSRQCKDIHGNIIFKCTKNGSKSYGCEFGSKNFETKYLFKNYRRKITFI